MSVIAYPIAESGFTVMLPSQPQRRVLPLPSRDGSLRVYQAIEYTTQPSTFSIFVGQPEKEGIFEPASMDAYLSGSIKSLVGAAESAKLQFSRRVTFRGQPALEYQFSHRIEGRPYIARGVTFMIDGGHMRVKSAPSAALSRLPDASLQRTVKCDVGQTRFSLNPVHA